MFQSFPELSFTVYIKRIMNSAVELQKKIFK